MRYAAQSTEVMYTVWRRSRKAERGAECREGYRRVKKHVQNDVLAC